ncbi:MAG: nuclear transport factor 2 family protein [Gemmatimonadales bacterium]
MPPTAFTIWKSLLLTLLAIACRPTDQRAAPPTATSQEQPSAAERVVQLQFDAYNKHDLEAFVAAHAPDVRAYQFPDSLILEGRDALRERFGKLFANAPQVHATVEARMTHGDFVVWRETATGLPGGKTNTGIFVWEVHDGQISRIMVLR